MVAITITPTWRATLRCILFVCEPYPEELISVGFTIPLEAPVACVKLKGKLPARLVVLGQRGAESDDAPGLLASVNVLVR